MKSRWDWSSVLCSSDLSAGSSSLRTPWSMRDTLRSSSASRMYPGGPSSPACATVRKPSARARLNTAENFDGGWPISDEYSPTAWKIGRASGRERYEITVGLEFSLVLFRSQRRIFFAAHTMVDAGHLEVVERFKDVSGRAFLAGMRDGEETLSSRSPEYRREFRRRMAHFGRVQSDCVEDRKSVG